VTLKLSDYLLGSSATLIDAAAKMNKNRSRTVLIVEGTKLKGLVSEGDLMRALLRGVDTTAPVVEAMNRSFRFLESADARAAFDLFREHAFGLVPIVDEGFHVVGVITLEDILGRVVWPEGA
jgi:CBS domain-containing protein